MMSTAKLVFEDRTAQTATRDLFLENPNLLSTLGQICLQLSETNFRVFLAVIEGVTTEIGMENALDPESLTKEFQFVELGRWVGEFVSQHPRIEAIRLGSALADLQRRLAGSGALPTCRGEWAGDS
jgi:hypothetical protein